MYSRYNIGIKGGICLIKSLLSSPAAFMVKSCYAVVTQNILVFLNVIILGSTIQAIPFSTD